MKIGVFFGSFNPIHRGHMTMAQRFLQEGLDEVWLSVSPQNPLKLKSDLLEVEHRIAMVRLAIRCMEGVRVTDFEKELPQPSYTYEALIFLKSNFPEHDFVLLIGGDNCVVFDQWRNYDKILQEFEVWAHPRKVSDVASDIAKYIKIIEAPLLNFASTDIRLAIHNGERPNGTIFEVEQYIEKNNLYKS